jgi:hypothetical protein
MDLTDLRIFNTVVRAGGITRAAEKASPGAIECHDPDSSAGTGPRCFALHPGRQAAASCVVARMGIAL